MSRFAPLSREAMSDEQRAVADKITGGPRGGMRGPFEAWLRSPALADAAQELGAVCRFGTGLAPDLRELAIIITAKHWKAQFEFWAHARLALQAGLAPEIVEAIRTGSPVPFSGGDGPVIHRFLTEYFRTNQVSTELYAEAIAAFGERGVVELVGVVGYYGLVSMTLNVFEVELPAGEPEPLA